MGLNFQRAAVPAQTESRLLGLQEADPQRAPFPPHLRNLPGACCCHSLAKELLSQKDRPAGPSLAGHEESVPGLHPVLRPGPRGGTLRRASSSESPCRCRTSRSSGAVWPTPHHPEAQPGASVCPYPHRTAFPFLIHTASLLATAHAVPSAQITSLWPLQPRSSCLVHSLFLREKPVLGAQKGPSCLPTTRASPPLHAAPIAEMTYFHVYPTVGRRSMPAGTCVVE